MHSTEFTRYYNELSEVEQYSHCGLEQYHWAHDHSVVFNEGPHAVRCPGTPQTTDDIMTGVIDEL